MRSGSAVVVLLFIVLLQLGCYGPRHEVSALTGQAGGVAQAGDSAQAKPPSAGTSATDSGISHAAGADAARPKQLGRSSFAGDAPPCDVQTLVETSCQSCHAREPGALAPMALVTQQDFDAPAVSDPSISVRKLAAMRIHDEQRPMPPRTSRRLTPEELERLDAFLSDPAGAEGCTTPPDAGVAPIDDLGECYRFQAHDMAVPGDTTPFRAPNGEHYACFYFAVPWPEGSQAVSLRSLDTNLTHHWQLYQTREAYTDGQIVRNAPNCGLDQRGVLGVYSHSEEREQRMPEGVGLMLPPPAPEHGILLEIHYYNPNDTVDDTTGVEVCTAARPRPNAADVTVLGVSIFELPAGQRTTIEGQCSPSPDGPIHVFRSFPHMHARGVAMDSTIARADGRLEPLLDANFDFNNQRMFDTPAMLQRGDQLRTRCHYMNDSDAPISSGFNANQEMCNLFVYAWPAGALSSGILNPIPGACLW